MAHVFGTSQAWQQVLQRLRVRKLAANNVMELRSLLRNKEEEHKKKNITLTARFEEELRQLLKKLEELTNDLQRKLTEIERHYSLEIEFRELAISLLKSHTWIIQNIKNRAKIKTHKRDIRRLKIEQDRQKDLLRTHITKLKSKIEFRQTHRDSIIAHYCSSLTDDIKLLKRIDSSPELKGAIAELEIIDRLKKLPDNCYVISGVTLVRDRAKQFDGQWLKTAQIDHLVISPAGVFVIEAKNWSKDFSENGIYFDPYQQVKRANYLCYEILRSPVIAIKVRSIIAHRGQIPEKPKESHAKVLHINQLNSYILWFKENILSENDMNEIISCLRIWSKNGF